LEGWVLGKKDRNEKMFYYVKIDDLIPEDHLLRLIHRYVDLGFVRKKMKHLYSHTGRPSIDPEVLLRMLLEGLWGQIFTACCPKPDFITS
jgi:transposase